VKHITDSIFQQHLTIYTSAAGQQHCFNVKSIYTHLNKCAQKVIIIYKQKSFIDNTIFYVKTLLVLDFSKIENIT